MINNITLAINSPSNAYLELNDDISIALQYSLADIKDISKRNAAYSKTIMIPGTKNNNYWLGNLFDVNSDFTAFNPNKKTPAVLSANTEVIIDGFLQLRKIKKLNNVDSQGNEIYYEAVLFNNTIDLLSELREKRLNELDLNEYTHTYNLTNIVNSWSNTEGYVYPLYGLKDEDALYYTIGDSNNKLYPAIYYKTVFDKIIQEAGYSWGGSLATNEQFLKEIIPYVGEGLPAISVAEKNRRYFRASSTSGVTAAGSFPSNTVIITEFYNDTYPYDTDIIDNGNHWDETLYEWTVDRNGLYHIAWKSNIDITFTNPFNNTISSYNSTLGQFISPILSVDIIVEKMAAGTTTWVDFNTYSFADQDLPDIFYISDFITYNYNESYVTPGFTALIGDKFRLKVRMIKSGGEYQIQPNGAFVPIPYEITYNVDDNVIYNNAYRESITEGDEVEWGSFLSSKLKQKDLITDLIKRYNLYIQIDPDDSKKLILDSRPDFYEAGDVIDWTDKKDYSREDKIELLTEIQSKDILFTFTKDSDEYNSNYEFQTNEIFGQFLYTFDNDFVKGEQNIQTPFSPTPLVETSFQAITPAIDPISPAVNPRVLIYGGLRDCQKWSIEEVSGTSNYFIQYPYAGYYDDPIRPNENNMFGNPKAEFYSSRESITSNTMYNRYWADYINQISEGKLVTSYFYLTESDISYIRNNFNTKIFIRDSYYYVNKIIDYNPLENNVTEVELIKVNEGLRWIDSANNNTIGIIAVPDNITVVKRGTKNYYVDDNGDVSETVCSSLDGVWDAVTQTCAVKYALNIEDINDISATKYKRNGNYGLSNNNMTLGINNSLGGVYTYVATGSTQGVVTYNNQLVIGNSNKALKNDNIIIGSNNISTSDKAFLIGSYDCAAEAPSILIGATGLTSSEYNKILLGNELNIDAINGDIKWQGSDVLLPTPYEVIKTSKVLIRTADVLTLYTTPVDLITAPAASEYIDVLSVVMNIDFNTTAYEQDTNLTIWCEDASESLFIGDTFLSVTDDGIYKFNQNDPTSKRVQIVKGNKIYITTSTDNPTTGDSDIEIIVTYRIVS